jgi:peptidoglycan/xylan/chitin deacetylase (PgdA/CDA1 family)
LTPGSLGYDSGRSWRALEMRDEHMVRIGEAARRAGIAAIARVLSPRDSLRIVVSHFVPEKSVRNFRALLDVLLRDREPATPAQILSFYSPGVRVPLRGNLLGLSFDDGLLSSYYAAEQVLKPLGLKAFFFVPTQIFDLRSDAEMRHFFTTRVYRSGRTGLSPHHYQTMSREHVRELHAQGHMVLPHTHSHARLDEINENELVHCELVRPKALLEDMLQTKIEAFAFPFGTERVVSPFAYRAVRQNYDVCFAGVGGPNTAETDRYSLHRDCVHPHFSRRHVSNISAGSFDLYNRLKMQRLRHRAGFTHTR